LRVKKYWTKLPNEFERKLMETLNETIARFTYGQFIKELGGTPRYSEKMIENGAGYVVQASRFV